MLAWPDLDGLDAYHITEIPRRPQTEQTAAPPDRSGDAGRTQRLAALIAAYHAGVAGPGSGALALGWVRHAAGGPVQFLAAGRGLVGSEDSHEVFLTLPGGARARPLTPGTLGPLLAKLPDWRAIGGISDGLLPDDERPDRGPASAVPGGMPAGHLARAVRLAADRRAAGRGRDGPIADRWPGARSRPRSRPTVSRQRPCMARRLHLRHAELRNGLPRACGGCGCPRAGSTRRRRRGWPGWSAPRPTWPACPTRWRPAGDQALRPA